VLSLSELRQTKQQRPGSTGASCTGKATDSECGGDSRCSSCAAGHQPTRFLSYELTTSIAFHDPHSIQFLLNYHLIVKSQKAFHPCHQRCRLKGSFRITAKASYCRIFCAHHGQADLAQSCVDRLQMPLPRLRPLYLRNRSVFGDHAGAPRLWSSRMVLATACFDRFRGIRFRLMIHGKI
jgi:hypothetical protein